MSRKKGVTLIELMITAAMFAMLAGVAVYAFRVVYLSWASGQTKIEMSISLDRAIEEMVRDIREATEIRSQEGYNEIRFVRTGKAYIYYLYNTEGSYGGSEPSPPGMPEPEAPVFDQESYELRRTELEDGIEDSFSYGEGKIMTVDIVPPPVTELYIDGNLVVIDISVSRNGETLRTSTKVRPRGL